MVFTKETEKKIVDTIQGSPLGLSSGEIAKILGLNRMTITKYLAIIKEKALIDFKQFGMAKLWYIPANISKDSFISKIMGVLSSSLDKKTLKSLSEKAGAELGEEINKVYCDFYDATKLSVDQISDAFSDVGKKLGGTFRSEVKGKKIEVKIEEHPFEENKEMMNVVLSAVFAKVASLNIKYDKTLINQNSIAVYVK